MSDPKTELTAEELGSLRLAATDWRSDLADESLLRLLDEHAAMRTELERLRSVANHELKHGAPSKIAKLKRRVIGLKQELRSWQLCAARAKEERARWCEAMVSEQKGRLAAESALAENAEEIKNLKQSIEQIKSVIDKYSDSETFKYIVNDLQKAIDE